MTIEELVRWLRHDLHTDTDVDRAKLSELLNLIEDGEKYDPKAHAAVVQQTKYVRAVPTEV